MKVVTRGGGGDCIYIFFGGWILGDAVTTCNFLRLLTCDREIADILLRIRSLLYMGERRAVNDIT